jgi:Pentapeptide repeats (8 copies)
MPNGNPIDKYSDIETDALALADRAKGAEILKNLADVRNSYQTLRIQRLQLKTTRFATWVPLLALIITLIGTTITLVVQNKQFNTTLGEQRQQSERAATLQRDASEDAQWREALKSVSFKDQPVLGAFAMQGFFRSPRYDSQARAIASALLTDIPNVNAFDEVITRIRDNTTDANFTDLSVVAQMLGFAQRVRFHMKGAASKDNTAFLIEDVDEINPVPKDLAGDSDQRTKVAAWEIDTASRCLRQVWKRAEKPASPARRVLTGMVLENAKSDAENFDGLNFSRANLSFGILYNASFRGANFNQAKLKDVYVQKVALDDADFSGVSNSL